MITRKLLSAFLAVALVIGISFGALSLDLDNLDGDPAFEKAVEIIKKYETLHKASNWPYYQKNYIIQRLGQSVS